MKLKVAIIDDEKHAIETLLFDLKEYHSNDIEIVFTATNPVEGLKKLHTEKPDLLFLDVDMPGLSGLDLVELMQDLPTWVVFTTAHLEYAVKAVETLASGYLLKPVQSDDLKRIIEKVKAEKQNKKTNQTVSGKIPVPDADGIELIPWDEIIYCKSDSNYCELNLTGERRIVASKTLKYFESNLPVSQFYRIHKSYLVNLHHIKKYLKHDGGELVMSNGKVLPVSRNSRDEILKRIL
ncbi:LytR/AlgR family response regulator transcription factor [Mariniphaga sp.]|uniref:LytR/AlgR family response regulator transcription factor n=1 Tax=Mariniphaga sp. TaxID=1954475 RepID=UPI003561D15B